MVGNFWLPVILFSALIMSCDSSDTSEDILNKALPKAEEGDANAQYVVASMFSYKDDEANAVKWYTRSAEQGYYKSQSMLCSYYVYGKVIRKDFKKGLKWCSAAVENSTTPNSFGAGHVPYQIGLIYHDGGEGILQDYVGAYKWYGISVYLGGFKSNEAAEKRSTLEEKMLPKQINSAQNQTQLWVNEYEQRELAKGPYYLAKKHDLNGEYKEALKWYKEAAEQRNADAAKRLYMMYTIGTGVPKDAVEAMTWRIKAASFGDAESQALIGHSILLGLDGFEKNSTEAARWFLKAGDQGNISVAYTLSKMYLTGNGVDPSVKKGMMWLELSTNAEDDREVEYREMVQKRYTSENIVQGQKLAKEWLQRHPQKN